MSPLTQDPSTARAAEAALEHIRHMVQACIQCGTCTGSCPNAFAMDLTPRHLWRLVQLGAVSPVFQSRTFQLCSACHLCTLRCPRGLPLTEAMHALKQSAARQGLSQCRAVTAFYRRFIESVRRHGRVRELELMTGYFADMKNPMLPLRYSSLGLKLVTKGKVSLKAHGREKSPLETLFRKVAELEAPP